MNPFSKKILYLKMNEQTKQSKLHIFDIEDERAYERNVNLIIINSLQGISQITIGNQLFLCGSNEESTASSAYLFRLDPEQYDKQLALLVNTIFPHYKPSLVSYLGDSLIVIGGKGQTKCEIYNFNFCKWKKMNDLPEERYKGTLFMDEGNKSLYVFGGCSTKTKEYPNAKTIFKLNIENNQQWEKIEIKENENFLARNSSIAIGFQKNIFICGGSDNSGKATEFIMQYNIEKKQLLKFPYSLKRSSVFDGEEGTVDLRKKHYVFVDNESYIHTISENDFKMSIFNLEDNKLIGTMAQAYGY